jgi:hypothetical protein
MAKKKDLKALGDVYSKLGAEVVVSEKNDMIIGDKDISVGEAPLEDGGITKDCGCEDPEEVEGTDAPGVKDPGNPKEEVAGAPEEDEENASEALEMASSGINKYMAKKSAFDELYSKVISEDFGMEEQDDLNALGIDDATPDDELGEEGDDDASEEEVTITLDKELAQQLCDLLKAACGEEGDDLGDEDVADELEGDDDQFGPEEDNEGAPQAFNTHYNDGKSNKVGNLAGDAFGSQPKVQAANKVAHKPTKGKGDTNAAPQSLGDSYNDGKSNKVGNLGSGEAFGSLKVQPKNKEVKAG